MSDTKPKQIDHYNHVEVESSNISHVGYHPETQGLSIRFKAGTQYIYFGVSPEKHKALMEAESIGKHFHKHIKDAHRCAKM